MESRSDEVPERVRAFRERLGLSQRDFGLLLGLSGALVAHWETGRSRPSAQDVHLMAEVTELPLPTVLVEIYGPAAAAPETRNVFEIRGEYARQNMVEPWLARLHMLRSDASPVAGSDALPSPRRHNRVPPFGHRSVKGHIVPAQEQDDDPSIAPYAGKHERLFAERIAPRQRQPVYSGT